MEYLWKYQWTIYGIDINMEDLRKMYGNSYGRSMAKTEAMRHDERMTKAMDLKSLKIPWKSHGQEINQEA